MTLHFHFSLSFKTLNFNDSKQVAGYLSLLFTNGASVSFIFKKARIWEGWNCASGAVENRDFCSQTKRAVWWSWWSCTANDHVLLWFWDSSEKSCTEFASAVMSWALGVMGAWQEEAQQMQSKCAFSQQCGAAGWGGSGEGAGGRRRCKAKWQRLFL